MTYESCTVLSNLEMRIADFTDSSFHNLSHSELSVIWLQLLS